MTTETLTDDQLFAPAAEPEQADDLADLLAELGERAPRFTVQDEASAAWVVDKLVGYDERIARLKAQYKDMLAGLEKDKARFEGRFLPELEEYFRHTPRKGKTIKLLTGTLSMRTIPGRWKVADADAAKAWAIDNLPDAVKRVSTVEMDAEKVLAAAGRDGEVIPGVEYIDERESFSVKGPTAPKKEA